MWVQFGNRNTIEGYRDETSDDPDLVRYRPVDGDRITTITHPDEISLAEAFQTTLEAMRHHIAEGETPEWVESDSEGLKALLAEHYGLTAAKTSRPKTFGKDTGAHLLAAPTQVTLMQTMLTVMLGSFVFASISLYAILGLFFPFLRTNAGRDFQSRVMGDTASNGTGAYKPAVYIGLTADATAASATSTTLTTEIVTGTLVRAIATYAHTNGTNTYTLTKTFTSDQTVTIAKIGVFNGAGPGGAASDSNALVFETLLNATASLVSGDQLQITETVTL